MFNYIYDAVEGLVKIYQYVIKLYSLVNSNRIPRTYVHQL